MARHRVRVRRPGERLPRETELAWALAAFATDAPALGLDGDVSEMVACRVLDNAAVALAAIDRRPVAAARAMALAHPRPSGATLIGLSAEATVHGEWAAWANGTAVRELDFHDTFLAADYTHPADTIPPLLAVAQQKGLTWTARYHDPDPARKAFGGRVEIRLDDGTRVSDERAVADAHPSGRRPWRWPDYVAKLDGLTSRVLQTDERSRVVGLVARLPTLRPAEVRDLNPVLPAGSVEPDRAADRGIF